jgi:hypothetical protein
MIKERIVEILEYKGVVKEDFFAKIGMTSANFRGNAKNTPLNSNAIVNILSEFPDINPDWLLTGKGKMLRTFNDDGIHIDHSFAGRDIIGKIGGIAKNDKGNGREGKSLQQEIVLLQQKLNAKEEIIASLQQQINGQSQLLEAKDKIIALLEGK